MAVIKFTATKIDQGKGNIVKKEDNGYYQVLIGGLNVYNSVGDYYTAKGASKLFEESSFLMRRISKGYLKGELGHPKREPGMSHNDYMDRLLEIRENNVACHFRSVWLDTELGKRNPHLKNPNLVGIFASVCGSGPHGEAFNRSMENPNENVSFSVRGFTNDEIVKGTNHRELINIITWDVVLEPGIGTSNKFDMLALEHLRLKSLVEESVSLKAIQDIATTKRSISTESRDIAQSLVDAFKATETKVDKPSYLKW